ncbi:MAG TPA: DeoR/GlpR family DNA-binding transcription regulator [Acidimicrobiales bacterium]|nr:DeoR/GlpR family DNA-binding transcription regulator [Acidimicrobiales bacterium]
MIGEKRRQEIHRRLGRAGYVEARQLAADLGVDVSTIRRDLDAMARSGLVQRTHGGALPMDGGADAVDLPYAVKSRERPAEKEAIAAHAASLVGDGDSVVLDSGSTTYALARAIAGRRNLTVATNDLHIAHFLATRGGVRLLVTGGQLIDSVFTLVGPTTLAGLAGLHVDWAFLGADAVDVDAGVTNVNTVEVPVKQAMLAAAARAVLLADSTKFGHRALAAVTGVAAFEQIVTDGGLPVAARGGYGDRLVCVPVAGRRPG